MTTIRIADRIAHVRRQLEDAGLPCETIEIITNDAGPIPRVVRRRPTRHSRPLFDETDDAA
jgi:hypothetical protein